MSIIEDVILSAPRVKNTARYIPTSKMKLHPSNPRFIKDRDFDILCQSIQNNPDFFEARPLLCTPDLVVFAGNMRLRAAKALKLKHVPVIIMDVDEEKQRELMIRDNVNNGQWDTDALAAMFEIPELAAWGMPEFVFEGSPWESEDVEQAAQPEAKEDYYEIPETIKTNIVRGDLFEIGPHRLLCGDSTSADDVAKLLNGAQPYLMITDPPYGVEYDANWRNEADRANGKPYGARAVGKVSNDDKADWSSAWALAPSKVAYVWHAGRHAMTVQSNLNDADFEVRNQIIWAKSNFAISRGHYHWKHEPCWYAVKKGAKSQWIGDHSQTTLWNIDKPQKSETGHSTQKPIECMARPIRNHLGDVYDPFLGSGTTMVAAHQLNRRCYGMEIDEKYCHVIVDRMLKLDPTLEIKRNGKRYEYSDKSVKNGERG